MVDPMNDPSMSAASTDVGDVGDDARAVRFATAFDARRARALVRARKRACSEALVRASRAARCDAIAIRHAHQTRGRPSERGRAERETRDDETTTRAPNARTNGDEDEDSVTNDDGDDSDDARYGAAANTARRTTSRGGRKSPARTQAFHALCTSTGARRLRVRTKTTHMRQPRKVRGRNCSREK